jgi:hypothetical protein
MDNERRQLLGEEIMKRLLCCGTVMLALASFVGCQKKEGYLYTIKVLRESAAPAEGFRVDAWVKGKSEPVTKKTGADGIVVFDDLPQPDATHQLNGVVHYFKGQRDGERKISYPFLASDAARLKDTQYIPNNVTAEPE